MPIFGKKKKNHVVSLPFNVKKDTAYYPVHGSWATVPRVHQWLTASQGGNGNPPRDSVLQQIDSYLRAYHRPAADWWEKLSALGQLYFLSVHWLKKSQTDRNVLSTAREPAVNNLFRAVVDKMCTMLTCNANVLPELIECYWGRALTLHGYTVDNRNPFLDAPLPRGKPPVVCDYLSSAQLEKYHLTFIQGVAWQVPWWLKNGPYNLVRAESNLVGWSQGSGATQPMMKPGFAGFVMTMGRELYMAQHHGNYVLENFFHSSYLAGGRVLCSGTMRIVNGRVVEVMNDSGHYQPTPEHLLNVVQALQMYGISPHRLTVWLAAYSWSNANGVIGTYDYSMRGDELLRWGVHGADVQARYTANESERRNLNDELRRRNRP